MQELAFNFVESTAPVARMKVVGVGGAGGNGVNRMMLEGLTGVEFLAINTDLQALESCKAPTKIQIGKSATRGLGAGADPEVGRRSIEEDKDAVLNFLKDTEMVFVTAGMGGGTGTGAAPIVAEMAKDLGALTVGIVTKPFKFEGAKRMARAEEGINELKDRVDTLIIIPNQRLLDVVPAGTRLNEAFRLADDVLLHATRGISDLISVPGLINLDFADVRTVMSGMGDALMGAGTGSGESRAVDAARKAISSPLLEDVTIQGALGVLVNITGGEDLTLHEVNDSTNVIFEAAGDEANIIFGAVIDENMSEEVRVTVIATGFHCRPQKNLRLGMDQAQLEYLRSGVDVLEIPAFERKNGDSENGGNGNGNGEHKEKEEVLEMAGRSAFSPDNLEIPTFWRKRI